MRRYKILNVIIPLVLITFSLAGLLYAAEEEEDKLIGTEAKDFTLKQLFEDEEITLSNFEGEKAVVLDFFETWCGPCRKALPMLNEFYNKHNDDVEVFSITMAQDIDVLKEFFNDEDNKIDYSILLDPKVETSEAFPHQFIPYMVIIDIDGVIIDTHTGFDPKLIDYLEEVLGLEEEEESSG